jgi:uncharacterized protein (DUF1697 family)
MVFLNIYAGLLFYDKGTSMRYISLLRGINVGGNKTIKMAELKTLYESLGFAQVQTLLQSGNVVFQSDSADSVAIVQQLETGIQAHFGFEVKIILRTAPQWDALITNAPFSAEQRDDPAKMLVLCLTAAPHPDHLTTLLATYSGSEKIYLQGDTLYAYYTDGMGRSKLDHAFLERKLKVIGTGRNWNTVLKLQALAQRDEA